MGTERKKEGTMLSLVQNEEVNRVHAKIKKRCDHLIMQNDINKALQITIGRHMATELNMAFNFRDFRFDRFLVECYEADRGDYFPPHRDNLAPSLKIVFCRYVESKLKRLRGWRIGFFRVWASQI